MRVLYATDGSAPAKEAQGLITALFDPRAVAIESFSVAPDPIHMDGLSDGSLDFREAVERPDHSSTAAQEAADHLSDEGFSTTSSTARGDPAREILYALESRKHDLVVLGASHSTWMGQVLLGSVGMHVLHHAPCSVIVTHRAPRGSGLVILGADGSDSSYDALVTATKLLDPERCSFSVATVVADPWMSTMAVSPPGFPYGSYTEHPGSQKRRVKHGWRTAKRASSLLEAAGFRSEAMILLGKAGPQLIKEADNLQADLVVVGSRGFGPLRRAYVGSTSDQLARHAPATLVARPRSNR